MNKKKSLPKEFKTKKTKTSSVLSNRVQNIEWWTRNSSTNSAFFEPKYYIESVNAFLPTFTLKLLSSIYVCALYTLDLFSSTVSSNKKEEGSMMVLLVFFLLLKILSIFNTIWVYHSVCDRMNEFFYFWSLITQYIYYIVDIYWC